MIKQNYAIDANTLQKLGIDALTEKLGPVGMIEFMRLFDMGYGDYTKDRQQLLEHITKLHRMESGICWMNILLNIIAQTISKTGGNEH